MALTEQQFSAYYGGNTHACVAVSGSNPQVERCGQILPPTPETGSPLHGMGSIHWLDACVRTESLQVQCGAVKKLYTPNFFVDHWVIILAVAAVLYWLWQQYRNKGDNTSDEHPS